MTPRRRRSQSNEPCTATVLCKLQRVVSRITMSISNESPSDWIGTEQERVYYRSTADRWDRGEFELATAVAQRFDGWIVVITMGPYRGHDLHYDIYADSQIIHIDCHAPAMALHGSDVPHRPQHPVIEHGTDMIQNIARDIQELDSGEESSTV